MSFGITDTGFVLKRLQDILVEQRQKAVEIFSDLLQPGEVVDTSDSSLIGRLIALDSIGDAELWETAQQAWSSFDPNSATGIALDNLVQYSGIARQEQTKSTVSGLFSGDNGVLIQGGSAVKSLDNVQFEVVGSVALSPTLTAGVTLTAPNILNNTIYSFTYTTSVGINSASYTSDASATVSEILNGLQGIVQASHPLLQATVVGSTLVINVVDVFQATTFVVSTTLLVSKVKKIGQLQSVLYGPINLEANTITQITTPVLGWDSVSNPLATSPGRFKESDEELRLRFRNTKLERSSNILDSLYSALLNVENVQEVAVYENDTDIVDSNGVQPHSFMPVVLGGSSQHLADTIWKNKPMGIKSQGNTIIAVLDSQGFSHNIGIERPTPVVIHMKINLTANHEAPIPFPADGIVQMQNAIKAYASSTFGVGKDVIYSRLFTPINQIPGHQVNSMFIGLATNPTGTSNIVVPFNSISSFSSVNISITIS